MSNRNQTPVLSDHLPDQEFVYSFAVLPTTAGSPTGAAFAARTSGLYRSDDGGLTWRKESGSISPGVTTTVIVSSDFRNDHNVFAAAAGGVMRSEDGGEHWQWIALPGPPPAITWLVISPNYAQDGVLLAGTLEDGVLRSVVGDHCRPVTAVCARHGFDPGRTVWLGMAGGEIRVVRVT